MGQVGGAGSWPGPGLGAIVQDGRQQLGQIIGRGGHRRGRGGVLLQGSHRRTGGAAAACWSRPRAAGRRGGEQQGSKAAMATDRSHVAQAQPGLV
jgi:hypothetical protein